MSFSSEQSAVLNQLPISVVFPRTYDEFMPIMDLLYKRMVAAINTKTGSLFSQQEFGNFEQFYDPSNPQNFRNVFRTVVRITTLAAGANTYAHNIPSITGFTFTHIYGTVQDTTPTLIAAIPQGQPTGTTTGVSVEVDATNVIVTISAGSPYIGFDGYVILEYTKN